MDQLRKSPNKLLICGIVVFLLGRIVKSAGYYPLVKLMDVIAIVLIITGEVIYLRNRRKK